MASREKVAQFKHGCDNDNRKDCFRKHESECVFRKVECPCRKCMKQIPVDELCEHIQREHEQSSVFSSEESDVLKCRFPINFGRLKGPHNAFDHSWVNDGRRFFARFQQVFPTWYAWVYVLASPREAQQYRCEITVLSSGRDCRVTYSGPIHPIDTPKKEVRNKSGRGRCLQLTNDTVDAFKSEEDITIQERAHGYNATVCVEFRIIKPLLNGHTNGFH